MRATSSAIQSSDLRKKSSNATAQLISVTMRMSATLNATYSPSERLKCWSVVSASGESCPLLHDPPVQRIWSCAIYPKRLTTNNPKAKATSTHQTILARKSCRLCKRVLPSSRCSPFIVVCIERDGCFIDLLLLHKVK